MLENDPISPSNADRLLVPLPVRTGRALSGFARHGWGGKEAAFTVIEAAIGMSIAAVGFLGAWTMALQAGRMVSAAEEETLVTSALEQRIDQLRELDWPSLTSTGGITTAINVPAPATTGLQINTETWVIAPYNFPTARTITAVRTPPSALSISTSGEPAALSTANAVQVTTTLRWTGRRSNRAAERSLTTLISRGGISKSAP